MNELSGNEARPSAYWKWNLGFIWASQFIAMMGFSYALPFVTFYLQTDLHVPKENLPFWLALFGAATPLTMTVFAPVWGAMADRFGRRLMLLRAYFGGMFVLTLMGVIQSPVMLIVLRLMQGALSGSVSASQTLVATHTPSSHSGFALGALNSAAFSGSLAGAFVGGWTAECFGYRTAFLVSGLFMLVSMLLVFFGVKEKFIPPKKSSGGFFHSMKMDPTQIGIVMPILLLMGGVMYVRQFDSSYLAVFVQDLHGKLDGASMISGSLFAVCGAAGVISGFLMGWLADRFSPGRIGMISAFCAAVFVLQLGFISSMESLFVLRFLMVFTGGGLEPVLQIWLCQKTPAASRGLVFGWAASARSMGWMIAPLCGGILFEHYGIQSLFIVEAFFFAILIFLIYLTMRRFEKKGPETMEDVELDGSGDPVQKVDDMSVAGLK